MASVRGRGGGGEQDSFKSIKQQLKQCLTFQILFSESQVGKYYPGDYRHKCGDREIQFKIWSLPNYLGELTTLETLGNLAAS